MLKYLLSYRYRTLFLTCFTIVGLFTSRAVMSIGAIAMFANILLDLNYKQTLKEFYKQKELFSLSLILFASLLSLTYSQNVANGFSYVLNKLPFLIFPLAYSKMQKMTKNNFLFILNFFLLIIFGSSLLVAYKYFSNFEQENLLLKQGQAIWVPFNHIRFSAILVFALVSSIYMLYQKGFLEEFKKFRLKYAYVFLSIFFFLLVNVLSVRSALLVLYVSALVSLMVYIVETKSYKLFILGVIMSISIPILSYNVLDSFKNRMDYMKYDWQQILNNKDVGSNSDSRRIISYKLGVEMLKDNFPLGYGTGSTEDEMAKLYEEQYPNIKLNDRILPHNEFLYILIDYGLLGLIALIITVFYPIYSLKNKRDNLFYILFWIITISSLFFDISFEVQIGITFFSLFSSLILKNISNQAKHV